MGNQVYTCISDSLAADIVSLALYKRPIHTVGGKLHKVLANLDLVHHLRDDRPCAPSSL
jgi:hypothetical protein